MNLAEIAKWANAELNAPDAQVVSVTTDSRKVAAGDLFVAIKGEQFDGHDFADAALDAGAVAVMVERPVDGPNLLVPDTLIGYGAIAAGYRRGLRAQVIGITGSSGKTSAKDILAGVLSQAGRTVSPPGSFNNEVGLPATVLSADNDTDFLVLEMGMRGLGHISYLCEIAAPSIGVLLNVGSAHLELLGTTANILQAKSELIRALPAAGCAVLFADDPAISGLASGLTCRVITFGESSRADVRVADVALDQYARPHFTLHHSTQSQQVSLHIAGEHQAMNAAAAVAAAMAAGMDFAAACGALENVNSISNWRMEVTERQDGVVVVNDAYNANPESMRAGLRALKAMAHGRRTWAVLGEMRELGPESVRAHDEIGRLCVRLDISRMVGVGDAGKIMQIGAREEGSWGNEAQWVPDVDAAIAKLQDEVEPGDVVFIKASRAVGLERVAQALLQGAAGENRPL